MDPLIIDTITISKLFRIKAVEYLWYLLYVNHKISIKLFSIRDTEEVIYEKIWKRFTDIFL